MRQNWGGTPYNHNSLGNRWQWPGGRHSPQAEDSQAAAIPSEKCGLGAISVHHRSGRCSNVGRSTRLYRAVLDDAAMGDKSLDGLRMVVLDYPTEGRGFQ